MVMNTNSGSGNDVQHLSGSFSTSYFIDMHISFLLLIFHRLTLFNTDVDLMIIKVFRIAAKVRLSLSNIISYLKL